MCKFWFLWFLMMIMHFPRLYYVLFLPLFPSMETSYAAAFFCSNFVAFLTLPNRNSYKLFLVSKWTIIYRLVVAYPKKVKEDFKCLKYLCNNNSIPTIKSTAQISINMVLRYTLQRVHSHYEVLFVTNQILWRPDLEIVPRAL